MKIKLEPGGLYVTVAGVRECMFVYGDQVVEIEISADDAVHMANALVCLAGGKGGDRFAITPKVRARGESSG